MDLSDEEKFFVAHFVLGSYRHIKPACGKYISLFSFLDQTDESIEIQQKQIDENDWYFCELLEKIYKQSNQSTLDYVFKKLKREGFFENENFRKKFLTVATWLYSKNSLRYFFEANKEAKEVYAELNKNRKLIEAEEEARKETERRTGLPVSSKSRYELDQDRFKAMKLLYKGVSNAKTSTSNGQSTDNWSSMSRPKLDNDGTEWWREQE